MQKNLKLAEGAPGAGLALGLSTGAERLRAGGGCSKAGIRHLGAGSRCLETGTGAWCSGEDVGRLDKDEVDFLTLGGLGAKYWRSATERLGKKYSGLCQALQDG